MGAGIALIVVGFMLIAAGVSRLLGGRGPRRRSRRSITLRSLIANHPVIVIAIGTAMAAIGQSLIHTSQ
jgi:predicted permease